MGSTDWTQGLIKNNKKEDMKLGGRLGGGVMKGSWREVVVHGCDQNMLYKCVNISKNKNILKGLVYMCIYTSL